LKSSTVLPIIPVRVDSDKLARAQAVTPTIEAGKVLLPESAPWKNDFLDETATFPNGVHDDCVDSMTQALNYLREQASHFNSFELFAEINAPRRTELDKEELWQKAILGYPMNEEEINRM
jgi:hypothetical protein